MDRYDRVADMLRDYDRKLANRVCYECGGQLIEKWCEDDDIETPYISLYCADRDGCGFFHLGYEE